MTTRVKTRINKEFNHWPGTHQTLTCKCGAVFRGREKLRYRERTLYREIDRPCPECGDQVEIVRSASDPELYTLGG